ncbi:GTPase-activating protein [Aureococcus anophagefferens]|uniref:GTPase-activating protein n=1 Tax=Aureococcus anophagefferens TaxID=44056 RepID=A0ABR1FL56_AURAN
MRKGDVDVAALPTNLHCYVFQRSSGAAKELWARATPAAPTARASGLGARRPAAAGAGAGPVAAGPGPRGARGGLRRAQGALRRTPHALARRGRAPRSRALAFEGDAAAAVGAWRARGVPVVFLALVSATGAELAMLEDAASAPRAPKGGDAAAALEPRAAAKALKYLSKAVDKETASLDSKTFEKHWLVLVEARGARSAASGARCVFCKSGKDRTGMAVTLAAAMFVGEAATAPDDDEALMLDRASRHEPRRVRICEKNTGRKTTRSFHAEDLEPGSWVAKPKPAPAPAAPAPAPSDDGEAVAARSARWRNDAGRVRELLGADEVDMDALRSLAWNGVPGPRRSDVWRFLLGVLAPAAGDRAARLEDARAAYRAAVVAVLVDVPASERSAEDQQTLRQILVDAPRTCPGVPLFCHDRVQALIVNVLYAWAVAHPRSGYVQGMNDLLAVLLVVLVNNDVPWDGSDAQLLGRDASALSDAELDDVAADAYGMLTSLLGGLEDHYTHRQPGLQKTIEDVDGLLRRVDADLHKHLDDVGVLLLQVTFRWINCLLTRELPMKALIRLWDTCLAEPDGFSSFFPYVCAAFLCHFSETIRNMESEDVHLFLQTLPTADWGNDEIETLLSEAYILSTLFQNAPSHLQHEPDDISPFGPTWEEAG